MKKQFRYLSFAIIFILPCFVQAKGWKIKDAPLLTPWSENVDPDNVLPEYPRPTMVRTAWLNLNGIWEFQESAEGAAIPFNKTLKEQILVPFAWESPLSGVRKQFESCRAIYRRKIKIPNEWQGQRVLLHFEAVDWETSVFVNGACAGMHKGGYDAFSFDITEFLKEKGEQEIIVTVYDPTDLKSIARGKQSYFRFDHSELVSYTPNSGIWQTVWLEPVPKTYIKNVKIIPNVDRNCFNIQVTPNQSGEYTTEVIIRSEQTEVSSCSGKLRDVLAAHVQQPRLWSPTDPFLYDVEIRLLDKEGNVIDVVESYAGMRKISIEKIKGIPRMCLNDKPFYQHGPLDQGYWPDGIYTPPTDEAVQWEIKNIKEWGFNMIRKHDKVESKRWYYWCDKLGIVVWQDMPHGGDGWDGGNGVLDEAAKSQFETELAQLVYQHWNHPSIIIWTVFNEHWGLFDVERLTENVMKLDPSRLVMGNSGIDAQWPHIDYEVGHIKDNHSYLPPNLPFVSGTRATVNGEYGALGYIIDGHLWSLNGKYFHDYYKDKADKKEIATKEYLKFMESIYGYIKGGLSATVYTQWTDVENEVNGLYTYDRKVIKLDKKRVTEANRKCYQIEF